MKKIAIIGSGGAGKSTFAAKLSVALDIPVTHLDSLYWREGWVETSKDIWDQMMDELVHQDSWLIDGNYARTMGVRLAAADTIIFLDLPRLTCLRRLVTRRLQYHHKSRPDMGPDCPERLTWEFILWVWNYPSRRPGIFAKLEEYGANKQVIVLRTPKEVRVFLKEVAQATSA